MFSFLLNFFKKQNLVIAATGNESVHHQWLDDKVNASFDLVLINYGDKDYRNDCKLQINQKGYKWNLIHAAAKKYPQILDYKAVWCVDDDVETNTQNINRLFQLFHYYDLNLAQPSLTSDSEASHPITFHKDGYILRYTNFVEIMAPVFSQNTFKKVLPTFIENQSGWGLDWIWPHLLNNSRCAIIDDVQVTHARPSKTGPLYHKFAQENIDPKAEKNLLFQKYDIFGGVMLELQGVHKTNEIQDCSIQLNHLVDPKRFRHLSHQPRRANRCSFADIGLSNRFLNDKIIMNR